MLLSCDMHVMVGVALTSRHAQGILELHHESQENIQACTRDDRTPPSELKEEVTHKITCLSVCLSVTSNKDSIVDIDEGAATGHCNEAGKHSIGNLVGVVVLVSLVQLDQARHSDLRDPTRRRCNTHNQCYSPDSCMVSFARNGLSGATIESKPLWDGKKEARRNQIERQMEAGE